MAASMFDQSGSLTSTDPKIINAAMRATGGQILPSSPAFKRAVELEQLRAVQLQMGMEKGRQAVEALKAQQALNPQTASGLPSDRVVTSDTGFKAVLDAQGNIVGTNAPVGPAPTTPGAMLDRREFNQGRGTMLEKAALGPNIRDAFLAEYAKTPTREQRIALAKKDGSFASMRDKFNLDAQGSGQVMDEAGNIGPLATMAPGEGVRRRPDMPLGPVAASLINKDYTEAGSPGSLLRRTEAQRAASQPILGGDQSVISEMAKAASTKAKATAEAAVKNRLKEAEAKVRAAQTSGKGTPEEIQALTNEYLTALNEADPILLSPEELAAKASKATNWLGVVDSPGFVDSAAATAKQAGLGIYDAWNNWIDRPYRKYVFGQQGIPDSQAQLEYLARQENLQRASGR